MTDSHFIKTAAVATLLTALLSGSGCSIVYNSLLEQKNRCEDEFDCLEGHTCNAAGFCGDPCAGANDCESQDGCWLGSCVPQYQIDEQLGDGDGDGDLGDGDGDGDEEPCDGGAGQGCSSDAGVAGDGDIGDGDGDGDGDIVDQDLDGIPDSEDNCPGTHNPDQADFNDNGIGDACDLIEEPCSSGEDDERALFDDLGLDDQFSACAVCHQGGTPDGFGMNWGPAGATWYDAVVAKLMRDGETETPPEDTDLASYMGPEGNAPHQNIPDFYDAMVNFLSALQTDTGPFAAWEAGGLQGAFGCASCHVQGQHEGSGIDWGPNPDTDGNGWYLASLSLVLADLETDLELSEFSLVAHFDGSNSIHPVDEAARAGALNFALRVQQCGGDLP